MKPTQEEINRGYVSRLAIVVGDDPFPQLWSFKFKKLLPIGGVLPGDYFEKPTLAFLKEFWLVRAIHPEVRTGKINFSLKCWFAFGEMIKRMEKDKKRSKGGHYGE